MQNSFREFHLLQILELFDKQTGPLDLFLRHYFRSHKAVGANDRRFVCEKLYTLIRWRGLIDHFCSEGASWQERLSVMEKAMENPPEGIPSHVRASFPKWYFDHLTHHFGEERALNFCYASNTEAPTTLRINPLKIDRATFFETWKDKYPISLCEKSPCGIIFPQRINFFGLEEFKNGFFEMQDEASQLVAGLVDAQPGHLILDYCAGSGGKTLAFAPKMDRKGQIFLHDVRKTALIEAKKRLKRAGIQNAQVLMPDSRQIKVLKNRMDWVLVDAPCSGSGTLRRNPDMKWKFTQENLANLIQEQREIVTSAAAFVKKGGKLVYATCSVFPDENEEQIEYFIKHLPLKLCAAPFQTFPIQKGMDGFFAATFERL